MNYQKVLNRIDTLMTETRPSTRMQYLAHIKAFLEFTNHKDKPDKLDVFKYIRYLRRKKYKDSYIDFIVRRPLRKLFIDGLQIEWPLRRNEGPRAKEEETLAPVLSVKDVVKLIGWVKFFGSPIEKMALALSTTYGLRRHEIARIRKKDIDLIEKTILVRTAKKGRPRTHLIPPEIAFILDYGFSNISETYFSIMFWKICRKAGVDRIDGMGWHAIRRALDTYLIDQGVVPAVIDSFLRWKSSGIMQRRYYKMPDRDVDEIVFKSHPFLAYWR